MPKRPRVTLEKANSSYFTGVKANIKFVTTGCTLLDCALGGGWAIGRIANVVGDRSTAKTALATEALINFVKQFPKGAAAYRESEAAFDTSYAEAMGLPLDQIDFGDPDNPLLTVEDFARDFDKFLTAQKKAGHPGIYVLDSLDALSDDAEMDNDFDKASFGAAKAKQLSKLFRIVARKAEVSQVLLLIVSQVRDNIGVMFGDKHKRSGGKALDFYASQVLWLSQIKMLKKTLNKVERPYGVVIKGKVKKNKVGLPFREAEFTFKFGYGVEDLGAGVEWLHEIGRTKDIDLPKDDVKEFIANLDDMSLDEYNSERDKVSAVVKTIWAEVEQSFLPTRTKY